MSYVNKLFPFVSEADFIRNIEEKISTDKIFCPIDFGSIDNTNVETLNRPLKAYHIFPCNTYVLNENEDIVKKVMLGTYGLSVSLNIIELDYSTVARRIDVDDNVARIFINGAYMQEDIVTDIFINSAANNTEVYDGLLEDIKISPKEGVNFMSWANNIKVDEAADYLDDLIGDISNGKSINISVENSGEDFIYSWLDSYFKLPEGEDMKNGGREVVPLLIGPTGVFKSATVKELCKKYDYRLVDFRVSFTSRLDYSGLFQMGEIDGKKYSYSCPMEEIVTCSDGFREYCRKAHDKVVEILDRGYILDEKSSDGISVDGNKKYLDDVQRNELEELLEQYKEYMKTPVLFFDEITRTTDGGVEGILVQLLNQKRFNNMTLNGCKFVAATNLNLDAPREYQSDLDDIYDVNTDLDVAYSNRFMPLKVLPKDVEARWFEWAAGEKTFNGKNVKNIHDVIIEFLKDSRYSNMVYNMSPVYQAIDRGLTDNEKKSQTFPNYRTWEMLSDYLYKIDSEYEFNKTKDENAVREYRDTIINGLISSWAGDEFCKFLNEKGYKLYTEVHGDVNDDVGDFLQATLGANVPALMIGPSSLGKTSRVKAYMKDVEKKTGLLPELIDVNLASCDTTDLMGMPTKVSLVDYVGGSSLDKNGLGSVSKELKSVIKDVCADTSYGMVDTMTLRAPDMSKKAIFKKALEEGREVILFFDECNRVKNPTIMSAMFECISDQRIFGISFKSQKDRVKIVAACNMAHSEMGAAMGDDGVWDAGDYGNAGSIDPALAARFSIYWKKNYDERDVKSWIEFMRRERDKGTIDGTILSYIESLSSEEAIKIIASVEKRKLEYAESSTRALFQLSKDIKSMRGAVGPNGFRKSLYNGKVIFDPMLAKKFEDVNLASTDYNADPINVAQEIRSLISDIVSQEAVWEPVLTGEKTYVNGKQLSAQDVLDGLKALDEKIKDTLLTANTPDDKKNLKLYSDTVLTLVDACSRLDNLVASKRRDYFESYVGESFTNEFLPFFNSVFGTVDDTEITIEMLEDDTLITPFLSRKRAKMGAMNTEQMVESMIKLLEEFWSVHSNRLPADNYAKLITGISSILPSADSMSEVLSRSGSSVDGVFEMAEGVGDAWIMSILKFYPSMFTEDDVKEMRKRIAGNSESNKKRKTRIL